MKRAPPITLIAAVTLACLAPAHAQLTVLTGSRRSVSQVNASDGNSRLYAEDEIEAYTTSGPFNAATSKEQRPPGGAISQVGRSSATLDCDFSGLASGNFSASGITTSRAETINASGFDPDKPPFINSVGESYVYWTFAIGSQLTNYTMSAITFQKATTDGSLLFRLAGLKSQVTFFGVIHHRTYLKEFTASGTATGTLNPADNYDGYEIGLYSRNNSYVESDGLGGFETKNSTNSFNVSFNVTAAPVVPSTDTYVGWRTGFFNESERANEGISGPAADPDGDAIPNISEYAFNLSPVSTNAMTVTSGSGTAGMPLITTVGSGQEPLLRLEFLRRKVSSSQSVTYFPQFSTDLSTLGPEGWTAAANPEAVTSIDSVWERVIIDGPTAAPRQFGRLKLTQP